jgi:hypothetical protein
MLNFLKKLKPFVYVVAFSVIAPAAFSANNIIDVLVVYTKGTANAYGGNPDTRINQLFQFTNQIYLDSNIDLEIRVANTMMVDYPDDNDGVTALQDITFGRDESLKGVAQAREHAKADMVIFYRPFNLAHGSCGQAWIGGVDSEGYFPASDYKDYMYSHIPINGCGDFVTAHELGHNMGLKHSHKQDGKGGTFDYALGYGEVNKFATIMAYQNAFNVDYWDGKVYKFSSPELTCKGRPCGIDREDLANGADARHTLMITAPQIANYYTGDFESSSSSSATSSLISSHSSSMTSSASSSVANVETNSPPASSPHESGGGGSIGFILLLGLGMMSGLRRLTRQP